MDAVEKAQSGHCGLPLGFADVATLLFQEFIKFDASAPDWPDRDRFVLSAGHGSMLLYSLLYLTGYPDVTLDEIKNFRQLGSKTPGHPEFGHTPASRPPRARWARVSPTPSAWRWPSVTSMRASATIWSTTRPM
jgi:transketolase